MKETATDHWTLAEIADANKRAGRFFFSRDTMKFFGDTMKSFTVRHVQGRVFVVRTKRPHKAPAGYVWTKQAREFNTETGDIGVTIGPDDPAFAELFPAPNPVGRPRKA